MISYDLLALHSAAAVNFAFYGAIFHPPFLPCGPSIILWQPFKMRCVFLTKVYNTKRSSALTINLMGVLFYDTLPSSRNHLEITEAT